MSAEKTDAAVAQIKALGTSPDDNYRVWYEIFVYSYCDSDGDGIGDLQGVISKLDELTELGVGGIWLMPVHPSTTYHKYNVSDYYAIDPAYGTLSDMEQLLQECDRRGIRVIMDLVVNHSGSDHPWFKEAVAHLQKVASGQPMDQVVCPYVDYYNFVEADACPAGHNPVPGADGWFYESRFDSKMPDLNLGCEAVRKEIEVIMAFWLEKGADGFRLDAAKEFYSGRTDQNIEVLSWLQQTAVSLKPDCYLVAEVWDTFGQITDYYKSGITSIFNYPFGNSSGKIVKVLQGAGNESMVTTWATAQEKSDTAYSGSHPGYIDAPFVSNHDVGRAAGFVGRDENKVKLAGAMNLFMSGASFLYYGDEIGMICGGGNDPSYRAPMYWNAAGDDGTTAPPPGCTLPEEYSFAPLSEQKKDDSSIYSYYRKAIAIRNALPVISHGVTTAETELNRGCVSAVRKVWEEQQAILLMNIDSKAASVDLSAYSGWQLTVSLTVDDEPVILDGTSLSLPAYGAAILTPVA